jgi:hypothetical protein
MGRVWKQKTRSRVAAGDCIMSIFAFCAALLHMLTGFKWISPGMLKKILQEKKINPVLGFYIAIQVTHGVYFDHSTSSKGGQIVRKCIYFKSRVNEAIKYIVCMLRKKQWI